MAFLEFGVSCLRLLNTPYPAAFVGGSELCENCKWCVAAKSVGGM
jgi:hypothetical protein